MRSSPWLLLVPALLLAPLVLAMSAFFAGLWQSGRESYAINEEELGT